MYQYYKRTLRFCQVMKPERLFGFRIGRVPTAIGWCSPTTALPHACLPVRWWIRFAAGTTIKYFRGCRPTGKPRRLKRATGTFLRAGFRIHNHLPPKQKKDIPFGMSFCFGGRWWIRTTEVIDDRFTVCPLWPLGKPPIFDYQLDWSWWTDLNPDLLITNQLLYQLSYTSVLSSRLSQRLIYNSMQSADCQQLFAKLSKIIVKPCASLLRKGRTHRSAPAYGLNEHILHQHHVKHRADADGEQVVVLPDVQQLRSCAMHSSSGTPCVPVTQPTFLRQ